jgi:hypothetical protein
MRLRHSRRLLVGTLAGLALLAAGCSNGSDPAPSATPATQGPAVAGMNFGPACSAVPASGAGSFMGMAQDPVATAASNNPRPVVAGRRRQGGRPGRHPELGRRDHGVRAHQRRLLGTAQGDLQRGHGDPEGLLTTVLTYHVVEGKLSPEMLAGTHTTLQGGTIEITGSGEDFKVNGQSSVVCGNVQTANATVYLIDGVLLPKG